MEAPQPYKTAGIVNMICGVLNIFFSLSMIMGLIWVCIGIWWFIPAAASAYQTYVGWQMYNGQATNAAKNASIAGMAGAFFSGNWLLILGGAFAFMQVGNDEVAGWLEQNGVA